MKKPPLVSSIVFFLLGVIASWAISYYYSSPQAYNRGVKDERTRCTEEAKSQVRVEEIEEKAKTLCSDKLIAQRFQFQRELSALQSELDKCRISASKDLANCKADVDNWKLRAKESIVRRYFAPVFDRLEAAGNQAKELGEEKAPGDQAINRLNQEAKSVLLAMAVGREQFSELKKAMNSEAPKLFSDLEAGRMTAWDLRDRIVPLADSRKEKEALADTAMNTLAAK